MYSISLLTFHLLKNLYALFHLTGLKLTFGIKERFWI